MLKLNDLENGTPGAITDLIRTLFNAESTHEQFVTFSNGKILVLTTYPEGHCEKSLACLVPSGVDGSDQNIFGMNDSFELSPLDARGDNYYRILIHTGYQDTSIVEYVSACKILHGLIADVDFSSAVHEYREIDQKDDLYILVRDGRIIRASIETPSIVMFDTLQLALESAKFEFQDLAEDLKLEMEVMASDGDTSEFTGIVKVLPAHQNKMHFIDQFRIGEDHADEDGIVIMYTADRMDDDGKLSFRDGFKLPIRKILSE